MVLTPASSAEIKFGELWLRGMTQVLFSFAFVAI
jgi:hypothetical protein